jgi:hypothetical protein
MYTDENGRYKSAGTYDTEERAQAVAEQHERHVRLRLAETSPADRATITVRDFGVKFLREQRSQSADQPMVSGRRRSLARNREQKPGREAMKRRGCG